MLIYSRYYNLITDVFQWMGRMSGHLCRLSPTEPIEHSVVRHEQYLAHRINIQEGQKVIDVGCGIGGPARAIARFTGANITGVNLNPYQIRQARQFTQEAGLGYQVNFVNENFLHMPFEDNTFDAGYAIEATCYSPNLVDVYREVFRVLKPGATFGLYEVVMTDKYDDKDPAHREVRFSIERGGGVAHVYSAAEAIAAIKEAGFELLEVDDLASRPDQIPWEKQLCNPLVAHTSWSSLAVLSFFYFARASKWGNSMVQSLVSKLEGMNVLPTGSSKVTDLVVTILDGMYKGGEMKIFSPMFLMVARKPVAMEGSD
jgi:sterol 24-C-methyltransferase